MNIVGLPLYLGTFAENVSKTRTQMGMSPGIEKGSMVLFVVLGMFLLIPTIIAYYKLQESINEVWSATAQQAHGNAGQPPAQGQVQQGWEQA